MRWPPHSNDKLTGVIGLDQDGGGTKLLLDDLKRSTGLHENIVFEEVSLMRGAASVL